MALLLIGILLWSGLHFVPGLGSGLRDSLIGSLGNNTYRIGFSVGVVLSIILMVLGWRSGIQVDVYQPPVWARPIGALFVLVAFILFGLAHAKTNIKRFIRHPQLTGVIVWAIGHLLANGDNLSLVLFGGLGIWALVEIVLINRREGSWQKPDAIPLSGEIRPVVTGIIIFAILFVAHPYLFGVSPIPR